ncbi:MAG: hypothetical protein MHM6MM_000660 [Cercozoa sp. M6MM]
MPGALMKWLRSMDPFVRITLEETGEAHETAVQWGKGHHFAFPPEDGTFEFALPAPDEESNSPLILHTSSSSTLRLECLEREIGGDTMIGVAVVDLSPVTAYPGAERRMQARLTTTGDFHAQFCGHVVFTAQLADDKLRVRVKSCASLRDIHATDVSDVASSNRSAVYCSLAVLVYLAIGTLYYATHERLNWGVAKALYFSVTTLTTIGYGDLSPETAGTRVFTAIYIAVGVSMIAFALSVVGSRVLEGEEEAVAKLLAGDVQSSSNEKNKAKKWRARILATLLTMMVVLTVFASVIALIEGWRFDKAIYFAIVTLTTVGYGDVVLHRTGSLLFASVWMIVGTVAIAHCIGQIISLALEQRREQARKRLLTHALAHVEDFRSIDLDGDNKIDRAEFLTQMLLRLELVGAEQLHEINEQFDMLDRNGDGAITLDELQLRDSVARLSNTSSAVSP